MSLIQEGDWKLVEFLEEGRLGLYNLRDDTGESRDLAVTMPDNSPPSPFPDPPMRSSAKSKFFSVKVKTAVDSGPFLGPAVNIPR